MKPAGLILAGGRSSRMGGRDKAFALLDGRPMIEHVIGSLAPQVSGVLINTNSDPTGFAPFGYPVLPDCIPGRQGPLAGILTGLLWAQRQLPGVTHLLSAPCDIPGLPGDIGARLAEALTSGGGDIAIARDASGLQPTIGLWPVALASRLAEDLTARDMRGMQAWLAQFAVTKVYCAPLHNINTPDELRAAAQPASLPLEEMEFSCLAP